MTARERTRGTAPLTPSVTGLEAGGTGPVSEELCAVASRYTPLDWHEVWRNNEPEPQWLVEPLLERGRSVALFSPPKAGKSLLVLEIAAALATGRGVLGNPVRPPLNVVYVDIENTPADLLGRLTDLDYGPDELGSLHYFSFPALPDLDSEEGGKHLLALAVEHRADLVVIDTVSRVIGGEENSADTFARLYKHALAPLKARGIAVLRLDHSGKDVSLGQRGSSAKASDVDAVWALETKGAQLLLKRTHSRTPYGAEHLQLVRESHPLRHQPDTGTTNVTRVVDLLDHLGVPQTAGRNVARRALADAKETVSNDLLAAALQVRKGRSDLSGAIRTGTRSRASSSDQEAVRAVVLAGDEVAGGRCPGQVPDSSGRSSRVPAADLSAAGPGRSPGQRGRSAHVDALLTRRPLKCAKREVTRRALLTAC